MFFFKLRKDLTNINNVQLLYNLRVATYIEQINTRRAQNYVNYLLDSDKTLVENISEKADVTYVDNTVSNITTIPSNISSTINSYVEQAINIINIEKQNALEEINNKKLVSLEEIIYEKNNALLEINSLSENVANQINGLNNSVKHDLLKKIDYLFEMFYHSDSAVIMELYPL